MEQSSRTSKAILGIVTGILQYFFTIILQFALAPLILKHGGSDVLGAYSFLMQMVSWAALTDLGFGVSVGRYLAQAIGVDDCHHQFSKVFTTGRTFYIISNLVFAVIILIFNANLEKFLITSSKITDQAHYSLILLAIWIVIRTPLSLYNDALIATQNLSRVNIITTIGAIVRLSLSLIFVLFGTDLIGLMLANIISELITYLLCFFYYHKLYSNDRFDWGIPDKNLFKQMLAFGFSYMIVMLSGRLSNNTDSIILGVLYGTTAVSIFYTSQMPGTILYQMIWKIVDNSAPAINELHAKNRKLELVSVYIRLLRYSLIFVLPLAIGLIIFNKAAITLWVGQVQYAGNIFTISLAIFSITQVVIHLNCIFLIAYGKINTMSSFFLISGITKVIISYLLARSIGIKGIMIASMLIDIIAFIYFNYYVWNILNISIRSIIINTFLPSLKTCFFPFAIIPFLTISRTITNWVPFIFSVSLFTFSWLIGAFIVGLSHNDRNLISIFLKSKIKIYKIVN
jgi:O-antigen/teichoic acid export membrane protein